MATHGSSTGKAVPLALLAAVLVGGCASGPLTTREKGTLMGGALGAGAGAIIGSATGKTGTGAVIGGAIGAVSGALIGDQLQTREAPKPQ